MTDDRIARLSVRQLRDALDDGLAHRQPAYAAACADALALQAAADHGAYAPTWLALGLGVQGIALAMVTARLAALDCDEGRAMVAARRADDMAREAAACQRNWATAHAAPAYDPIADYESDWS